MTFDFSGLDHDFFMREALKEAKEAGEWGDLPVGTVIVHADKIISRGSNWIETADNYILHAEIDAIHKCASFLKKHARECVLYTTVEPCIMCLATIVMANIRHVVFAVKDQYMNMDPFIASNPYIKDRLYHYVGGVLKEESEKLIQTYSPYMYQIVLQGKKPGDAP